MTQAGTKDDGVISLPVEKGDQIGAIGSKVQEEDYTKTFTKVENPATFEGGATGWRRFLEKNLQYPMQQAKLVYKALLKYKW